MFKVDDNVKFVGSFGMGRVYTKYGVIKEFDKYGRAVVDTHRQLYA